MLWWILTKIVLFLVFVPGMLLRLPSGASLRTQAFVHGLIAATVLYLLYTATHHIERMTNPSTKKDAPCPKGSHKCPSGDCVLDGDKHSPCH
jgi:hypothetical protein